MLCLKFQAHDHKLQTVSSILKSKLSVNDYQQVAVTNVQSELVSVEAFNISMHVMHQYWFYRFALFSQGWSESVWNFSTVWSWHHKISFPTNWIILPTTLSTSWHCKHMQSGKGGKHRHSGQLGTKPRQVGCQTVHAYMLYKHNCFSGKHFAGFCNSTCVLATLM